MRSGADRREGCGIRSPPSDPQGGSRTRLVIRACDSLARFVRVRKPEGTLVVAVFGQRLEPTQLEQVRHLIAVRPPKREILSSSRSTCPSWSSSAKRHCSVRIWAIGSVWRSTAVTRTRCPVDGCRTSPRSLGAWGPGATRSSNGSNTSSASSPPGRRRRWTACNACRWLSGVSSDINTLKAANTRRIPLEHAGWRCRLA